MSGLDRFKGWRALVTGASAGIGMAIARELARGGVNLVITARREAKLEELATELRQGGVEVDVVAADLSTHDGPGGLADALTARGLEIDLLVNNAGLVVADFFTSGGWEAHRTMLQVNTMASTELMSRLVPPMMARGRGHVVNVGSVAGFSPMPRIAAYGASKAYVDSLSRALRFELRHTAVGVTAVHPGGTRSEFTEKGGMTIPKSVDRTMMDAADVARIGMRAAARGRARVVTGWLNVLSVWLFRWGPSALVMRSVDNIYRKLQGGPERL